MYYVKVGTGPGGFPRQADVATKADYDTAYVGRKVEVHLGTGGKIGRGF